MELEDLLTQWTVMTWGAISSGQTTEHSHNQPQSIILPPEAAMVDKLMLTFVAVQA